MQDVIVPLTHPVLIGKDMKEKYELSYEGITQLFQCFGEDNELNAVDALVNMYRNPTDVQLIGIPVFMLLNN